MRKLIPLLGLLPLCGPAWAGAWTQGDDTWQAITGLIASDADRSFGTHGNAGLPAAFERALLQTDTEYGWDDDFTLFLRTETAYARLSNSGSSVTALSNAFEGGARYRIGTGLLTDHDVLSAEGTVRTAGAFNFTVSANNQAGGQDAGLRILYGTPLRLFGDNGFLDAELGQRWLSHPRPDETAIDLTAGLWVAPDVMVMLQSFNIVSGPAAAPYAYFRSHKVEASGVWKISGRYSVQAGAYFSPAGQNALEERGLCLSLWANF